MKKFLFVLFLFPIVVLGIDTVSVYPPQEVLQFKGLDDTSSPLTIEDGRATALQNVKLSRSLKLKKRDGYNTVNKLSTIRAGHYISSTDQFSAITGIYYTKFSDTTEHLLVTSGTSLYYDSSDDWIFIGRGLTYNDDYQFVWITALDNIIFSNDVDVPKKSTGTTLTDFDVSDLTNTLTQVKCLAWFKNYLILANTVEAGAERPTRFRWSDVGTIETFQDDNYLDIAALGGQEIEAVAELRGDLYFLLTDSIWKCSLVGGDEIFVITKIIDGIGCIAKNSVQNINFLNQRKALMFLSRDKKVHIFDGASIVDASARISEEMDDLKASRLPYAVSAYNGTDYYLAVTTGTTDNTNNLVLNFQTEIGEWTKHTQIDANAMAKVTSSSIPLIYFGNYDSMVYELDDTDKDSDVYGMENGIASVESNYNLPDGTATGLTMIVLDTALTTTVTGVIVYTVSGTGEDQEKVVIYHTLTGLIVDSAFTTTPDATTVLELGTIDAYYTTKWFDLGEPARRKLMGQVYLWGETTSGVDLDVMESLDFVSNIKTENVDLAGVGDVWGTGIWGTAIWGGETAFFEVIKLSDEGRFLQLKFSNDDVDEQFNLYGYSLLFWPQDYM